MRRDISPTERRLYSIADGSSIVSDEIADRIHRAIHRVTGVSGISTHLRRQECFSSRELVGNPFPSKPSGIFLPASGCNRGFPVRSF